MNSENNELHRSTPNVLSFDPRGLTVRSIGYYRCADKQLPGTRIQRQKFNVAGQLHESYDARLGCRLGAGEVVSANLSIVRSLGGTALASASTDAGWKVELLAASEKLSDSWAPEDIHFSYDYDRLLRLLSVSESDEVAGSRVVERYTYSDASFESSMHNSCGRLSRHDHLSGTKTLNEYALGGECIQETDRYLGDLESSDWPLDETQRNMMLESHVYMTTRSLASTGELLSHVDAALNKRIYCYDMAGQLKNLLFQFSGCPAPELISATSYNEFGQVNSEVLGNNVVTRTVYDPASGRLNRVFSTKKDGSRIRDLNYKYDPVGNVIEIENKADVTRYFKNQCVKPISRYKYDTFYQLIEAVGQEVFKSEVGAVVNSWSSKQIDPGCRVNYKQTYTYDFAGNLIKMIHEGAQCRTTRMLVDAGSNRSLRFNEDGSEPDLIAGFDACGNQKLLQGGLSLQWNSRGQLCEVASVLRGSGISDTEYYRYGVDGERSRKVTLSQAKSADHRAEVRYLPALEERIHTLRKECFHVIEISSGLTSVRALHWISGKPDVIPQRQLRYCLSDHLKSVNIELDAAACSISEEEFYPFGGVAVWAARGEVEASYKIRRYSGRERERCGIYYFGRRYYAPWLHRWLSADPAGTVDGLNVYLYVRNNPIGHEDVTGLNDTPAQLLSANFRTNVEPLVLSRASQDQQAAENRLAEEWGLRGQPLGEAVVKIVEHLKTSPHSVNVRYSSVAGFSGDYLKNAFETGTRQGFDYYFDREGRNKQLVNYSGAVPQFQAHAKLLHQSGPYASIRSDLQPGAHPTHGSIQVHDRAPVTGGAPHGEEHAYGASAFFLTEGALSYLTYTAGDSMDLYDAIIEEGPRSLTARLAVQGNIFPLISYADPQQLIFYKENLIERSSGIPNLMHPYVEWQSHNTILFQDMSLFTVSQAEVEALPSASRAATMGGVTAFLSRHNIQSSKQAYRFHNTYA